MIIYILYNGEFFFINIIYFNPHRLLIVKNFLGYLTDAFSHNTLNFHFRAELYCSLTEINEIEGDTETKQSN